MTKEQERISAKNNRKAREYFGITDKPELVMHHIDINWITEDVERYIQWNPEDLEVMTISEHVKLHRRLQENPFKGKHHTEEQKKKWSEMYSGSGNPMYGTHRFGELNPNYGNHYSEESKKKISESLKGHKDSDETRYKKHLATSGENNPMYGKEHPNKGKKMYNNGVVQVLALECPEGFVLGRLRKAV